MYDVHHNKPHQHWWWRKKNNDYYSYIIMVTYQRIVITCTSLHMNKYHLCDIHHKHIANV